MIRLGEYQASLTKRSPRDRRAITLIIMGLAAAATAAGLIFANTHQVHKLKQEVEGLEDLLDRIQNEVIDIQQRTVTITSEVNHIGAVVVPRIERAINRRVKSST